MNELVEKLVEQAGLYQGTAEGDCPVCSAFDYKKFAELIVRECIQYIDEENVRLCQYQNSLPEWDGNRRDDCDLVIEKCLDLVEGLKEHFGVEERFNTVV